MRHGLDDATLDMVNVPTGAQFANAEFCAPVAVLKWLETQQSGPLALTRDLDALLVMRHNPTVATLDAEAYSPVERRCKRPSKP